MFLFNWIIVLLCASSALAAPVPIVQQSLDTRDMGQSGLTFASPYLVKRVPGKSKPTTETVFPGPPQQTQKQHGIWCKTKSWIKKKLGGGRHRRALQYEAKLSQRDDSTDHFDHGHSGILHNSPPLVKRVPGKSRPTTETVFPAPPQQTQKQHGIWCKTKSWIKKKLGGGRHRRALQYETESSQHGPIVDTITHPESYFDHGHYTRTGHSLQTASAEN